MSSFIDDYEEQELKMYMEDRVLEAINKIPVEEQYFLIIVLFLKFVFCYGVENTTVFIIFILNFLKLNKSSASNDYYNFILRVLIWLNTNLQELVDKYVNTKPDVSEIKRYKAFEDYLLLLEAKLYVLLGNLTCCHGEIFGKQYLTRDEQGKYTFDEKKLIELLSPDIPVEIMNQLKEKYKCDTNEECMNKMIKDINYTPEVVSGLTKIVEKQNQETGRIAGQKVKIKRGVTTYLRNDSTPIDLSEKMVYVFNEPTDYNRIVRAKDGEWYIGYYNPEYNIDPVTGQYRFPNRQEYIYYTGGNNPIQTIVFSDDEVTANVKPMKCYRVNIEESRFPIVLPADAFDLNNIETYIENPEFKNAFDGIKEVIYNVFTNQDENDKYIENYLNGVAEKEYRTKERFFEMIRYIFGAEQYQDNDIQPRNEEDINPYALDIVAPPILHGCDVGIRYIRDGLIYFTERIIENTPAFRLWLLINWNNMINEINELLRRRNMRRDADAEIPTGETNLAIVPNNNIIPPVSVGQIDLILSQPPTRPRAPSNPQGRTANTEEQEEARDFVRGVNERGARLQNDRPRPNDLYDHLEISRDATQEQIKTAYRRLARQWHPDKNRNNIGEATARFQQISLAYSVLSDDRKRARYDYNGSIGGKTIKHRKGRRKGTKYIKTNKRYKKKIPRKTIKKHQKKSSRKRKTRRIN